MLTKKRFLKLFSLISCCGIAYIIFIAGKMDGRMSNFIRKYEIIKDPVPISKDISYTSSTLSAKILITKAPVLEQPEPSLNPNLTTLDRNFYEYLTSHIRDTNYPGVENYTKYTVAKSKLKPLSGVKSLRPDFGPVLNDVTSFQYPIDIQPCEQSNSLFVAVISGASNFERREMIRQTWVRHLRNGSQIIARHGFIIGLTADNKTQTKIEEESRKYGDVLQINMTDNYYTLPVKVVGLINWLYTKCPFVKFVFKVDDDLYVNVHNLVALIKTLNATEQTVYGSRANSNAAQRVTKWAISYDAWPWKAYPVYPTGAAVVYPGIVIGSLLAAAQTIPYIPFEDGFVNGLCTEKAKIQKRYSNRIFTGGADKIPAPCHIYNYTTWGISSVDHLNISHLATEDFYKGLTQCVMLNSTSHLNYTVNPMEAVFLPFTSE